MSKGALAGLVVIELGSTVAGPFCGRLFADFGADVIKVEDPEGDTLRQMGEHDGDDSLYAASLLRNKKTISLDLRTDVGRGVARKLIQASDVVIENFRPGKMEEWGFDYAALSADNPKLVMVRISGFGQTGPYSLRPGYGVIGEAVSGLRSITGDPDRPPSRVGMALTDYLTGLYAAFGALAALQERQHSGRGQVVDAALYECAFSLMEGFVPAYARLGSKPVRAGSRLPGSAPNNLYTARDGVHVHITAFADPIFRRLCGVMQQPGLADDERFRTGRDRARNMDQLDQIMAAWAGTHDGAEVERLLSAASVPASRIFGLEDIFLDPHFRSRDMLVNVQDGGSGELVFAGPVPKLSRTPPAVHHRGHGIGADTRPILEDMLSLSGLQLDELALAGAFGPQAQDDAQRRS